MRITHVLKFAQDDIRVRMFEDQIYDEIMHMRIADQNETTSR
jgi:hypothetical protein